MQTISFTQLRTEPKRLMQALKDGESVGLIHRSKVVAEIKPKREKIKVFDAKSFERIIRKLNLPHLSYEERERRYREAMEKKHGKGVYRL